MTEWVTVTTPNVGQGWQFTVPSDEQWTVLAGVCKIVTSNVNITRVPGIVFELDGYPFWVNYNFDFTGTAAGPGLSSTSYIAYEHLETTVPRTWGSGSNMPFPCQLPVVTLPGGTDVEGLFRNLQTGDQVSEIQFLIERAEAETPPVQPVSGTFGFALRFN